MTKIAEQRGATDNTGATATPFFRVWIPSFLVFLAYGLGVFGLNWWIVQSPGGGALLGVTVGTADLVAVILVVLVSGVIDRTDRRLFLLKAQLILMAAFLLLLPAYIFGPEALLVVALAVAVYLLIEGAHSVHQATLETTLIDLVPGSWASGRTASLLQLQLQSARLVAPPIGGVLVAIGLLWLLPVISFLAVALTSITFVAWAAMFTKTASKRTQPETQEQPGLLAMFRRSLSDAKGAYQWIKSKPVLIFMLIVGFMNNLIVFPFYTLLPAFLIERNLGNEALLYGWSAGAYGAGMLVSTLLIAGFVKQTHRPVAVVSVTTLAIVTILALVSVVESPALIIALMGALGMLFVVLIAVAGGTWIDLTPAESRARIFSLRRLAMYTSIPLGTTLMGFGGAAIGFVAILRVLVCLVAISVSIGWLLLRTDFFDPDRS